MISTIASYSYDVFAVTTYLGTLAAIPYVLASPFHRTPLVAGTITAYSGIKTAYYAYQFFSEENTIKNNPQRPKKPQYIDHNFKYELVSLDSLKQELNVHVLKKERDDAFQYTCKVAKLMIPVLGVIWVAYNWLYKQTPKSKQPEDTWTDRIALEFHINYLKIEQQTKLADQKK